MGRLYCYALAAAGVEGAVRALEILEDEMYSALGLLGVSKTTELDKSYLHTAQPTREANAFSAFPLLNLDDPGYSGGR
jgi:isopentenyl diphosphate isomerase/L-lactate dehydrogenase-like FMN-dependent dehydrogenase